LAPPTPPNETVQVKAIRPDRDHLEIRFPRVEGYRVELPTERLTATFTDDSKLELTPDLVGPTTTRNQGIIGEAADLTVDHLEDVRPSTLLFHLTKRLLYKEWRDPGEEPKLHLFGQLKRIYCRRMLIDISFDFRKDTPDYPRRDPDACSPTLRRYHKFLWSKSLPGGAHFDLDDTRRDAYLYHGSTLGQFFLSSDSVIPSFTRWGFAAAHPELFTAEENEGFMTIGYTIGGMMVFPGNQVARKWTINQARGCLSKISDGSTSHSSAFDDTTWAWTTPAAWVRH
jgi:hypothetical protein